MEDGSETGERVGDKNDFKKIKKKIWSQLDCEMR